jgi:hypothetical protein
MRLLPGSSTYSGLDQANGASPIRRSQTDSKDTVVMQSNISRNLPGRAVGRQLSKHPDGRHPHIIFDQKTRKIMHRYTHRFTLGLFFVASAASAAPLPAQEFNGRGTQVYRCGTVGGAPSWQLLGPDAHMYDTAGMIAARHFFGPSWQANDGSEITGKTLVANGSPAGPNNAPWLVLRIISEQGPGIFAHVWMVTRTDTHGGGTPSQACTAASQGVTVKMPYSARYTFFSQAQTTTAAE